MGFACAPATSNNRLLRLCKTAVAFLLQESEKRALFIAKSPTLYSQLQSIALEKLPARRDLMMCLVMVGRQPQLDSRTISNARSRKRQDAIVFAHQVFFIFLSADSPAALHSLPLLVTGISFRPAAARFGPRRFARMLQRHSEGGANRIGQYALQ